MISDEPRSSGTVSVEECGTVIHDEKISRPSSPTAGDISTTMHAKPSRGIAFWLVFLAMGISTAVTALELSAVSTALPSIVHDLHGTEFAWVGSAYALAASAFIPLTGGLAQVFGRRMVALLSLAIMAAGSAVCGAAWSMNSLIVGRTLQGVGGGGISAINAIIVSDLVSLRERGVFNSLIGIAWAIACSIGPIVGGSLAQVGQWRWLFYLNIPICGLSALLMFVFLRIRTPPGSVREKLGKMDWIGNILVVAATTAVVIALTWSGINHPWNSVAVLVPFIFGLVGLAAFVAYEAVVPEHPVLPFSLMSTITGLSGYLQTFIMPIIMLGVIYYIPVYFQACKGASPIKSGDYVLAMAAVTPPVGVIAGLSVKKSLRYRPQIWMGWVAIAVGVGLFITLDADTPAGHCVGYLAIVGAGLGILTTTTYFPVLAPLPVHQNALALAFFMFLRNFAQVWGVTIGGNVLQNQLLHRLPSAFLSSFPHSGAGAAVAYATIPTIHTMPEPLRTEVRVAFAESLKIVWMVFLGISVLGLVSSFGMKSLPLHTETDEAWALHSEHEHGSEEMRGMERIQSSA